MKAFVIFLLPLLSMAFTSPAQTAPTSPGQPGQPAATAVAQTATPQPLANGTETVQFKTSAVCDMCKARLEKSLAYEKGVRAANLDVSSKVLTVSYNPAKTTAVALRAAVQKTGYDADELTADSRAYERLPECCKKTAAAH